MKWAALLFSALAYLPGHATANCPPVAQVSNALDNLALNALQQAAGVGRGEPAQAEPLMRSERAAISLLQYRHECLATQTDWSAALSGQASTLGSFERYQRNLSLLVQVAPAVQRLYQGHKTLEELAPVLQSKAQRFVDLQKKTRSGLPRIYGFDIPVFAREQPLRAQRLLGTELVDAERLFEFAKGNSSFEKMLADIPESFPQRTWGVNASELASLANELRSHGGHIVLATGAMLGNIQSVVAARRAEAELRKLEAEAIAEYRTALKAAASRPAGP